MEDFSPLLLRKVQSHLAALSCDFNKVEPENQETVMDGMIKLAHESCLLWPQDTKCADLEIDVAQLKRCLSSVTRWKSVEGKFNSLTSKFGNAAATRLLLEDAETIQEEIARARVHLDFVVSLYRDQFEGGLYFIHERPLNATSWMRSPSNSS